MADTRKKRLSSAGEEVPAFLRRSECARHPRDLEEALAAVTRHLGFTFYALVHHDGLTISGRDHVQMTNYPQAWRDRFVAQGLAKIDPVHAACRMRVTGFRWSELSAIISLTTRQTVVLRDSRCHGLGSGYTVPLHLPGTPSASCSFAVPPETSFPCGSLYAAQLIAGIAFEAAQRLGGEPRGGGVRLTPRQRDCVELLAAGMTDREIGRRLALSEESVTKYLNAARRRHGFKRRSQLVAAALRDGAIGFDAVIGPERIVTALKWTP